MISESELQKATELYKTLICKGFGQVNMESLDGEDVCISVYSNFTFAEQLAQRKAIMQYVPADELGEAFEVAHFNFPNESI